MPADPQILQRLRSRIAAIERGGTGTPHGDDVLPLGICEIDEHLPWGGLAAGAVHEVLDGDAATGGRITRNGITKSRGALNGAITGFAAALAGRAQRLRARPVVWIAPRTGPRESLYAPGLAGFGLDPTDLIAVRVPADGEFTATALWAMEEALRAPAVGLVCAEIEEMDLTASRRLQLAAEKGGEAGGGLGLLLRRDADAGLPPTASVSRWRIESLPGAPAMVAGTEIANLPGAARWRAELMRVRGGRPRTWHLEWNDDAHNEPETAGGFALVSPLRDRPLPKESEAKPAVFPRERHRSA